MSAVVAFGGAVNDDLRPGPASLGAAANPAQRNAARRTSVAGVRSYMSRAKAEPAGNLRVGHNLSIRPDRALRLEGHDEDAVRPRWPHLMSAAKCVEIRASRVQLLSVK